MKKTINRFMQSFTRKGQGFSRWLVLIMALVMVLTLAACGDKDPVDSEHDGRSPPGGSQ